MSATKGGHNTPFLLFAKLMEVIHLEDIKHHFKVYPKSFRGESAIATMTDKLGFDKTEASECLSGVLFAQLIINVDKPRDTELKPKSIYCLSVKGALVLRDVKAKRLINETPEAVYAGHPVVRTNLVYVDRDNDGNLVQCPTTMNLIFKYCLGDKVPNFHKFENPNLVYTEGSPEVESIEGTNGQVTIWPLFVKDKAVRLKAYTHAFSGTACVDWILRCTSVVSRLEAIAIASHFLNKDWIICVNPDDAVTPVAGSPASVVFPNMDQVIKDSIKAIYQPTPAGAKYLGWNPEREMPGLTSAMNTLFTRKKSELTESSRQSLNNESARNSVNETNRKSNSSTKEGSEISKNPASKSLNFIAGTEEDAELYGWESCHTNLISMDGTKSKSKATSAAPSVAGSVTSSSPAVNKDIDNPITKILHAARPKVHAIKKLAAANHKDSPEFLPMDPSLPRDPLVLQLKERTHNLRLVMILENPELREQFRKYCLFMYSQENFNFWSEADAYRRLHCKGNELVIPGQPIRTKEPGDPTIDEKKVIPPRWQIVAHAMSLYLKYIVDDGPYEINVGIIRKKNITATVATDDLMPYFELINPENIITENMIEPKTVLLPGTEPMLVSRLPAVEKNAQLLITASLFDVAENHIFQLMATDSVPKFLKTTAYHNTMSALIKAGTLKTFGEEDVGGGERRESSTAARATPSASDAKSPNAESIEEGGDGANGYEAPKADLAKFAAEKKNSIAADAVQLAASKETEQSI
ncbi:hypothetical protein HDU79_010605 [Rhizoclosmatium sp. JEL0117]|nr:hypothetical protein HDU79_010605 [Rhizoclosmatium sp. JEL0117]